MSDIFWQIYIYKIYVKYILNIQLSGKIYFIHFNIYLTYIFVSFFSIWVITRQYACAFTICRVLSKILIIRGYYNFSIVKFCHLVAQYRFYFIYSFFIFTKFLNPYTMIGAIINFSINCTVLYRKFVFKY